MGIMDFIRSVSMLLKIASKPTWEEYSISLRITLLGIAIIGAIAFVVKFLVLAIQGL